MTGNISQSLNRNPLTNKRKSGGNLFGFITGWEFTGYQGLASHGAAISIIIAMYYFSKNILQNLYFGF
jgi:prolipoprotein diacylglyceryltransferase